MRERERERQRERETETEREREGEREGEREIGRSRWEREKMVKIKKFTKMWEERVQREGWR